MTFPWDDRPVFCLTADVDWASEHAIMRCQALFDDHGVTPTYFGTHSSPLLDRLLAEGRIDMGIHPNFLSGSSQGEGFEAVLDSLKQAIPAARCFRAHRYFDVTDTNIMLAERGFQYDSNLFSFLHKLEPHEHFSGMVRFPCCWEDGTWLRNVGSLNLATIETFLFSPGLTILSVHPMHMALNSPTLGYAREIKDTLSREQWNTMDEDTLQQATHQGRGIRDFMNDMLAAITVSGHAIHTLTELHSLYIAHAKR